MDRNLFLAFALSFAVLTGWMLWQGEVRREELARRPQTVVQETPAESREPVVVPLPTPSMPTAAPQPVTADEFAAASPESGEQIRIEKPLYTVELNSRGAGIERWSLREYKEGSKNDRQPVVLTTGEAPFATALVTPFSELNRGDLTRAVFDVVVQGDSSVVFSLERKGVTVRKSYEFEAESYTFRVRVDVENESDGVVSPRFAVDWPAHTRDTVDFREQALGALHGGSVERGLIQGLGKLGFFGSLTGGAPEKVRTFVGDTDWVGFDTTYFLGAILADEPTEASARFIAVEPGVQGVAQLFFEPVALEPGQSATREFRGYVGPKEVDRLTEVGGGTVRAIDLGWSWISPMTRFFSWTLRALYSVIPNYGVAIVILTVLVRLVTAPLMAKQMRSMEGMRGLQPKIKEIQEKFTDDRQKQSEAMMALYKREGVNPLGGCLPMVLQLPVMIGLFYALRSSIELREAPFFGWITDLSAPETLFEIPGLGVPVRVLPLIMGATMFLQQRMTPQPTMDAMQARMMTTMMPIVMTVVFYQFASGLVLYWMLSNVLAIAHQLWIRRGTQPPAAAPVAKREKAESKS
jgi:YidC/Oxa1 family membrane protein insertase